MDSIAHKTALEVVGQTIAILPAGLSNIYPARNRSLVEQIAKKGGSLISER